MMKFQKVLSVALFTILTVGMLMLSVSCLRNNDDSGSKNPTDPGATPAPQPDIPGWTLVVNDTLQNTPDPGGREFSNDGWFTDSGYFIEGQYHAYILYKTDIVRDIIVEFDAVGYKSAEWYVNDDDEFSLIHIHDAPAGTNWRDKGVCNTYQNGWFRMFKMGNWPGGADSFDGLKLKAGYRNEYGRLITDVESKSYRAAHPGFDRSRYSWDSNTVYHWRFEIYDGDLWVYRNGEKIYEKWASFRPRNGYNVYIGGAVNHLSPDGVTYSNVRIYRRS